jgi:hypothetical protein
MSHINTFVVLSVLIAKIKKLLKECKMKPSKDLYLQCNDQGLMSAEKFEETFCNQCKNRECVRAGWAFSNWDKRILTQEDRLLINPNIASKEDSEDWADIPDFAVFREPERFEVWGGGQKEPDVVVIAEPSPPAPQEEKSKPVQEASSGFPQETTSINVPIQEIYIGSSHQDPPPKHDPWAVVQTVKVGGKFKMGG